LHGRGKLSWWLTAPPSSAGRNSTVAAVSSSSVLRQCTSKCRKSSVSKIRSQMCQLAFDIHTPSSCHRRGRITTKCAEANGRRPVALFRGVPASLLGARKRYLQIVSEAAAMENEHRKPMSPAIAASGVRRGLGSCSAVDVLGGTILDLWNLASCGWRHRYQDCFEHHISGPAKRLRRAIVAVRDPESCALRQRKSNAGSTVPPHPADTQSLHP